MGDQEINLNFVKEVEKHELLYNYKLPEYSRKDITEKAWEEVAGKVNMSVAECKRRWRNIRTVFIRKVKVPSVGSGARKRIYYLEEAMQFCLPYIKTWVPPSTENLLQEQKHETIDIEDVQNEEIEGDSISLADSSLVRPVVSPSTQPSHLNLPTPLQKRILNVKSTKSKVHSSSITDKRSVGMRDKGIEEAYKSVATFLKPKKSRMETTKSEHEGATSSHNSDRKDTIKMFLLSLIPELEELSDFQIKLFKRRILNVIDEISITTEPQRSSIDTHFSSDSVSSHSSCSNTSDS